MTDQAIAPTAVSVPGFNNYGKPKQELANKLATLSDDKFVEEASNYIWLSAWAANNPRSDYHWIAYLCYNEAIRRGKEGLYEKAYDEAYELAFG